MSDVVERAKAVLEGVTDGPWVVNREGWAVISSGSDSEFYPWHGRPYPEIVQKLTRLEGRELDRESGGRP